MYRQTDTGDYHHQPTSLLTRKSILRDTEGGIPSWISPDRSLYDGKEEYRDENLTMTIKKPGMGK